MKQNTMPILGFNMPHEEKRKIIYEPNSAMERTVRMKFVNNPCPCGSEKKYKKCCMHKTIEFTAKDMVYIEFKSPRGIPINFWILLSEVPILSEFLGVDCDDIKQVLAGQPYIHEHVWVQGKTKVGGLPFKVFPNIYEHWATATALSNRNRTVEFKLPSGTVSTMRNGEIVYDNRVKKGR